MRNAIVLRTIRHTGFGRCVTEYNHHAKGVAMATATTEEPYAASFCLTVCFAAVEADACAAAVLAVRATTCRLAAEICKTLRCIVSRGTTKESL